MCVGRNAHEIGSIRGPLGGVSGFAARFIALRVLVPDLQLHDSVDSVSNR